MKHQGVVQLGVFVTLTAALGAGCTQSEDATAAAVEALEPASNSTDSAELAGLLRGDMIASDRDTAEGFRCDASPDITYTTVCDRSFPATVHLEWSGCTTGLRPPPPATDGGLPPPPPGSGPGPGGHHHRDGHFEGTSSGSADLSYTVTLDPTTECGAGAQFLVQQVTTFQVQRSGRDGRSASASGTSSSNAVVGADGPLSKSTQMDVTRSFSDGSGTARTIHLTGGVDEAFDRSSGVLVRTLNGDLAAEYSDGAAGQIQLVNLVRPPRQTCRWPTSGSVIRTDADGTAHTLTYGPACGQATLDGQDISLQRPPGGGGCGGMAPPTGGTSGTGGTDPNTGLVIFR